MITGLITVRTTSTRFNNKCLSKFSSFETLIEFVINRCLFYEIDPIICTSLDQSDDIIEDIANRNKIKIFRGSLDNKMKRWSDCSKFYDLENFHSIDADDPFFDGERMKESMKLLLRGGYDYVKPSYYSDNGGATEGYSVSTSFLNKVSQKYNDNSLDTEMAVYYFEKFKNAKNYVLKDPPYAIKINNQIPRLTLDYFEDYIFLNHLSFIVSNHSNRTNIEKFLKSDTKFCDINIHLNELWKKNQLSKKNRL